MREIDVELLCCPVSAAPLVLREAVVDDNGAIVAGTLAANDSRQYPIVNGVPRFAESDAYSTSFGVEWQRWSRTQFDSENVSGPMARHSGRMWDEITGMTQAALEGQTVVEFGCGAGRFLEIVRSRGGRAVGLELSGAADVAARNFRNDPDVLIVQGDVLRPPFKPGVFDGGYTIGVLHHTPDPARGLKSLARSVMPGGWVACCVYPKAGFYDFPSVRRIRTLQRVLEPYLGYGFAEAYSKLAAHLLAPGLGTLARLPTLRAPVSRLTREWLPVLALPDRRWSELDMFDAITPTIATTHDRDELLDWFSRAGCTEVTSTPWCSTSAVARAGQPA